MIPASSVTPQILTNGARAAAVMSTGSRPAATKRAGGGRGIGRAHQRLADQRRIEPGRAPARDGRRVANPQFRDGEPVAGDELPQPHGLLRIDVQRPQIPVVDPDQAPVGRQRRLDLPRVVGLDEGLQPEVARLCRETCQPRGRVEHREEQHEVGPGSPEEIELPGIDDEILGEDGDRNGRPAPQRRSSTEPPNQCGSHSTEMTEAPPAA